VRICTICGRSESIEVVAIFDATTGEELDPDEAIGMGTPTNNIGCYEEFDYCLLHAENSPDFPLLDFRLVSRETGPEAEDGWSDGQFGAVCPDCILLDPEGAGEPGDFLDLIESAQRD
jgi:hypothetical protein